MRVLGIGDDAETLVTEEDVSMTCGITLCEIGTMGRTRTFEHWVKKD